MFRRALLVLAAAGSLVALTAVPASAAADASTCRTFTQTATTATICVDATLNDRGLVIIGTAPVPPPTVVVHSATMYQCGSTCSPIATDSGSATTQWSGAYGSYAFGHTYYGCAEVTIVWGVGGVSAYYPSICSGERTN